MVALVRHRGAVAEPVRAAGMDLTDAVFLVPRVCTVNDCNGTGQLDTPIVHMLLKENSEAQQAQNPSVAKSLDQHEAHPAWEGERARRLGLLAL